MFSVDNMFRNFYGLNICNTVQRLLRRTLQRFELS